MLHGLMGSLRNWIPVGKALARGYEVPYRLEDHGASPWSTSMAWADLSADLLRYVECFESEGLSSSRTQFRGKVAMHFATACRAVASLVVVDIAAKAYPPHYKEAWGNAWLVFGTLYDASGGFRLWLRRFPIWLFASPCSLICTARMLALAGSLI